MTDKELIQSIKLTIRTYLEGCTCGDPGECVECAHGALIVIAHKVKISPQKEQPK